MVPQYSKSSLQPSKDSATVTVGNTEAKLLTTNPPGIKAEEKPAEKKRIVSDIHEMFHDTPTIANRFSDQQTVASKIAGGESTKRVSDQLKSSVTDLKSAIGLNEKFQFISHLFNGDAKKYNTAIDKLNACPTAEVAMKYVQEISDSNNWESYAPSAKSFLEIIERRFSV